MQNEPSREAELILELQWAHERADRLQELLTESQENAARWERVAGVIAKGG